MSEKCDLCGRDVVVVPHTCYESEVAYVRKVIPVRGCIYDGARPAFESGEYHDDNLARMLKEGVIIPSSSPDGGYVLPKPKTKRPPKEPQC